MEIQRDTILCIDDDKSTLMLLERGIGRDFPQYKFLTASTYPDALHLLDQHRQEIAILISDGQLDGTRVVHGVEITSKAVAHGIPLVFMLSAVADIPELEEDVTFIPKPFERKRVTQKISELIHSRGLTRLPRE